MLLPWTLEQALFYPYLSVIPVLRKKITIRNKLEPSAVVEKKHSLFFLPMAYFTKVSVGATCFSQLDHTQWDCSGVYSWQSPHRLRSCGVKQPEHRATTYFSYYCKSQRKWEGLSVGTRASGPQRRGGYSIPLLLFRNGALYYFFWKL